MNKKILMLHGYSETGPVFGATSGCLRQALEQMGYTLTYVTVPLLVDTEQQTATLSYGSETSVSKSWVPGSPEYEFDYLLELLHQRDLTDGGYEGVIGLSRFAAFGPTFKSHELLEAMPGLKWSISLRERQQRLQDKLHTFIEDPQFYAFSGTCIANVDDILAANETSRMEINPVERFNAVVPTNSAFAQSLTKWITACAVST